MARFPVHTVPGECLAVGAPSVLTGLHWSSVGSYRPPVFSNCQSRPPHTTNKLVKGILGDWEITGIITKETGLPFTIFSGKDNSLTGLTSDRGIYITGQAPYGSNACSGRPAPCVSWLNPNAFAVNPVGTFGNVGKGALNGPGLFNWDMGAFKNITITERWRAQLRGEFFNTFNHTNFTNSSNNYPIFGVSSGGFGTVGAAGDPRIIQLAMKVVF